MQSIVSDTMIDTYNVMQAVNNVFCEDKLWYSVSLDGLVKSGSDILFLPFKPLIYASNCIGSNEENLENKIKK